MEEVEIINGEKRPIYYTRPVFDQLMYDRTKINLEEHREIINKMDDNHEQIQKKLSTRNLIEWIFRTIVLVLLTFLTLNK